MVLGCFSGRGLCSFVELNKIEKVNKYRYLDLIMHFSDSLVNTGTDVFQQEGTSSCTAKSVTVWLNDCGVNFKKG